MHFFFLMIRRPPRSTRTYTPFPYTTLFRSDLGIPRQEIMDLADNAPSAAEAMLRLYRSFVDRRGSSDLPEHERTSGRGSIPAAEWVQEYIQGHRNFFQDLDEAADHPIGRAACRERVCTDV